MESISTVKMGKLSHKLQLILEQRHHALENPSVTLFSILCIYVFICLILEIEHEQGRARGRERKRENLKQALCSAQSPMRGSIPQPWDHDLSQNQESDAQLTEPPRHPKICFFFIVPGGLRPGVLKIWTACKGITNKNCLASKAHSVLVQKSCSHCGQVLFDLFPA